MNGLMRKSTAVIIIVAVAIVVALLGFLSGGFTNGDVSSWVKERNPDNLLDYVMPLEDYNKGDGTIVNIKDDGTINVTGTIAEDSETWEYKLGEVVLPAGTYTLTADKKCSLTNFIVTGRYTDDTGEKEWNSDVTGGKTVTLAKETTVTFYVRIFKEGDVNITLRPILNTGTKPIDYYVTKSIGD